MKRFSIVFILAALFFACQQKESTGESNSAEEAARTRAQKATKRLMQALSSELSKGLQAGPPEQALRVCSEVAQRFTEEIAAKEGIGLRRTALRLRNPKNAPDQFERMVLETWERSEIPPKPVVQVFQSAEGKSELRYLQPIVLQPMCTTCHGSAEEIPAAVLEAIDELYAEDQAKDFRPGQLRGAVSVRIPLE